MQVENSRNYKFLFLALYIMLCLWNFYQTLLQTLIQVMKTDLPTKNDNHKIYKNFQ